MVSGCAMSWTLGPASATSQPLLPACSMCSVSIAPPPPALSSPQHTTFGATWRCRAPRRRTITRYLPVYTVPPVYPSLYERILCIPHHHPPVYSLQHHRRSWFAVLDDTARACAAHLHALRGSTADRVLRLDSATPSLPWFSQYLHTRGTSLCCLGRVLGLSGNTCRLCVEPIRQTVRTLLDMDQFCYPSGPLSQEPPSSLFHRGTIMFSFALPLRAADSISLPARHALSSGRLPPSQLLANRLSRLPPLRLLRVLAKEPPAPGWTTRHARGCRTWWRVATARMMSNGGTHARTHEHYQT